MPSGESQKRDETCDLDPETQQALGKVSAELAWLQVKTLVQHAIQEYPYLTERAAKEADLRLDMMRLTAKLETWIPEDALNLLHESNPDLNLADLYKETPVAVFRAVAKTLTTNDTLACRSYLD